MTKIRPEVTIQKRRTDDEMRAAIDAIAKGTVQTTIPPQIEDTAVIVNDMREELLAMRQVMEDFRGFVNVQHARMQRR